MIGFGAGAGLRALRTIARPRFIPAALLLAVADGGNALEAAAAPDSPLPGVENVWRWYLLPAALLIPLALVWWLKSRARSAGREDRVSTRPRIATRTVALLESQDGDGGRHPVTSTLYRIGRHSKNDLSIEDASVSRHHAEINQRRDGSFTIADLDSMNGVFVNHKRIDFVTLADGDVIEIGDRTFRFRITEPAELIRGETPARRNTDTVARLPNGGAITNR